jgi:rare lipoprotein A
MIQLLAAVLALSCTAAAAQDEAARGVAAEVQSAQVPSFEAHAQEASLQQASLQQAAQEEAPAEIGRGLASWYGPRFHGRRTASGEKFDMHQLTAAHRTLPFGTVVRVQSQVNGRTVDVRINDRGPFIGRRIIDLSRAAAEALGLIEARAGTKAVIISVPRADGQASPPQRRRSD